jgi:cellobiose phosphorylase
MRAADQKDATTDRWEFIDDEGTFVLPHPERTSYLYFPLANEAGMMSSITPELQGDSKTSQATFLLTPVTVEDLGNACYGRNFWLYFDDGTAWSVAGRSARQRAEKGTDPPADEVSLEAGFLWHKVVRRNRRLGLEVETINFVPARGGHVELMRVEIRNTGAQTRTITPTAAVPIFGRSADSVRDHRHVTSLLHRISTTRHGVVVQATLLFNEGGHGSSDVSYAVSGAGPEGEPPIGFFPVVEDFVGEGGHLDWPQAVTLNRDAEVKAGESFSGYEALGGLRFATVTLRPGETADYRIVMGIVRSGDHSSARAYLSENGFAAALNDTARYWREKLGHLAVHTSDPDFDRWLRWVTVQPILRRIYGCSFLPYHDYGRGGRGWRDLWQDYLSLQLIEVDDVRERLLSNFAGVRIDGSNATIIGHGLEEFIADRNRIARLWMDHGAWPWLTTRLYIDRSGDLAFLLEDQTYFRDMHLRRCQAHDDHWRPGDEPILRTRDANVYAGSVLEHLVIQNATSFFNVGSHNNLRLEDADWNDGMDMARRNGESVAFSSLYGGNLVGLSQLLYDLASRRGITKVHLAKECLVLLDTLRGGIDYSSVTAKQAILARYLDSCTPVISGEKVAVPIDQLAADLRHKGDWILNHVRQREWIGNEEGFGWFNGYYDDDGRRVEGDHDQGVRMTLPGQVFALMSGAATDEQAEQVVRSVNRYLWDGSVGGCRLNTDFREVVLNLGRCFGFAFGHKENGAMFCHMAVMYAYALYSRGLVHQGHRILDTIYRHSVDFPRSRMLPGIPEYFNARGRGMYPYLTGSASWYVLTTLTMVFGVRGRLGDLSLHPRLVRSQFDDRAEASVETIFAGRKVKVVYHNPGRKDAGAYKIRGVNIAGNPVSFADDGDGVLIARESIDGLEADRTHEIRVELG